MHLMKMVTGATAACRSARNWRIVSAKQSNTGAAEISAGMQKTLIFRILVGVLLVFSTCALADQENEFQWPNGVRAAVNLAYDDALDSQLDHAIPALNQYGFKGSFYLTLASDAVRLRLDDWRAAAGQGHELGNHTLFHQCSASLPGREWVKPYHDLDQVSVSELREHIVLANTMLYAIDGQSERTFTTPCGDLNAGGENYIDAVRQEFVAIKTLEGGVTPDMNSLDPYAVGVAIPVGFTGEQLIAVVREAATKGTMANLTFHGVGGDHLSVSTQAHEQLLQHLAENPDIYWVDTFLNIMKYVKNEQ
jgi:peptidoglycan/xylan/chitin deacetylase (PgdA/CDA1 family)